MGTRRETEKTCNRLLRFLKGVLVLYVSSCWYTDYSAAGQLPLPATEREIISIYGLPTSLREMSCNNRKLRADQDLPRGCINPGKRNKYLRRRKKKNAGMMKRQATDGPRCRCVKSRIEETRARREYMQADQSSDFLDMRPKLRVCKDERCLTFTSGRKSFTSAENSIVSASTYIEARSGVWEVCGEYAGLVSCVVMSGDNFLDIFDDESVRVTTFSLVNHPNNAYTDNNIMDFGLDDETAEYSEGSNSELLEKIDNLENKVSSLSDDIYRLEDVLQRSTNLLLQDNYKNEQVRRKFMKVLERIGDT